MATCKMLFVMLVAALAVILCQPAEVYSQDSQGVNELIQNLRDEDPTVRAEAAGAPEEIIRPRNRFGGHFSVGRGFEETPMFHREDGGESKISFGGGRGFGLHFGSEITENFYLATDLSYQVSTLRPLAINASAVFGRAVFSVTPSYILPVSGCEKRRLKFGVGLAYYFLPFLVIAGSEVPEGFDDVWEYGGSPGINISALYSMTLGKVSMDLGLKYYYVTYEFESGGNHYPIEGSLIEPNGSGIDFVMGFYFNF